MLYVDGIKGVILTETNSNIITYKLRILKMQGGEIQNNDQIY